MPPEPNHHSMPPSLRAQQPVGVHQFVGSLVLLRSSSTMRELRTRFAVFLTGYASPYTTNKYGGYGQMLVDLLGEPGETWDIFPVVDGVFPSPEQLDRYDGFVLTGSPFDAHGDEDWILKLCEVLHELHLKRKKLLGVCFGHQVLSRALGGKTGRAPVGWELGARQIKLSLEAFAQKPYGDDLPSVLRVIEAHQDQVSEIPLGAELLGYSGRTPVEIFSVGDHVLGIQGHPEFEVDVVLDIIESRLASGMITEKVASCAKASISENKPDKEGWQNLCRSFLKK